MSDPEGKIIEYEPSMAEDVAEMFNRFKEAWPGGFGGGVPFDEERIRDWLDESHAIMDLIAVDEDGVPVGFCNLIPHWRDPDAAYVELLGVIPRVMGKKYGKRLLLKTIEMACEEGIERVDLHTWSGNLNAMPLYKKIGMFWVPDTTVYMQDYIPLLHQNEFTKGWFDIHPDWYQHQQRELKQEPDGRSKGGMEIYRYSFEAEDDWMEVDMDRYAWGITGIRRKLGDEEFSVCAEVDSHDIHVGIENSYTLEIVNDTREEKELQIDLEGFDGVEFLEDIPASITVGKGETKIITRDFIVSRDAEKYDSANEASEYLRAVLTVDDERIELKTGGKIEDAVEIDGARDLDRLLSGVERKVYFDLKNNTERPLKGGVTFEVSGREGFIDFELGAEESSGFNLPLEIDFGEEPVRYIELTPSMKKDDDLLPMGSYRHPLVRADDGTLAFAEKEDDVYLVNDELKVEAEKEGGKVSVSETVRDSQLPYAITQQVGPPFGRTQDSTLSFKHEVMEDGDSIQMVLQAESVHRPGVLMKRHVKLKRHSLEVEFWSELENVSDGPLKCASETSTKIWGFQADPYQSKARTYTPLADGVIESDPMSDMLSSTMMPMDPDEWEESWTAFEDMTDGAVSGFMWEEGNIEKVKLTKGLLDELKSVTRELEPGESFESTRLWVSMKKPSLNSFRQTWNKLIGREEMHPDEQAHGKKDRGYIEVGLNDNILRAGGSDERTVTIDKAVDYPMPGVYTVEFPEALDGGFDGGERSIEITEGKDQKELHFQLEIKTDEGARGRIEGIHLHFSGERELDFELPVIVIGGEQIDVDRESHDRREVLHVDNGTIQFDVLDGFGGNLIGLKGPSGRTYLDDNFPEPEPKSWFENHLGGVEPRLMTPDDMHSFYEIEQVSSEVFQGKRWKGVKVDFKIGKLDSLRGQKFSIKYLTLPGTKLVKIVMEHENPKEREINWLGQLFIDVLLDGSLEDNVVKCPGRHEDWGWKHQTQQFTPSSNIEEPWFHFRKEDISLGGFAVQGSPTFSSVICNEEINMAMLVSNLMSQPHDVEEIEMGIMLDASKEEIKRARRALK